MRVSCLAPPRRAPATAVSDESPRLGLDRDELARFLTAAAASGPRDHALACLLALNGLRISEALNIDTDTPGRTRAPRPVHRP